MIAVFTHSRCSVCDRKLTVHQDAVGKTCDDPRCKQQKLRQKLRVESQRTANALAKLTDLRDRAVRMAGIGRQPAPIAALPSNDRKLTQLPGSRRELFRENLEDSIAKAVAARETQESSGFESATRSNSGPTEAEQAVMGNACAICRGLCCEGGGSHAFLNPVELRKKLEHVPGTEPANLVAYYLSKLPSITFEDSCVFHTRSGCALDREDRSEMCNNYYCASLSGFWHGLSCGGSLRGFVGAVSDERVMRFALIDQDGAVEFANY